MNETELRNQIAHAMTESEFKWRTARGISKDTGLKQAQVVEVLERSDYFVKSKKGNARGEALYTTTKKYKESRSFTERFLSALTNKQVD